jgi:hypothetical protein
MPKKVEVAVEETITAPEEVNGLLKGFYIIDGGGSLKCVTRNVRPKGKPAYQISDPLRYRTIKAANDVCAALGGVYAVLCVGEDGFPWGEA